MSTSSLLGAVGVAIQSAKDSAATIATYTPATQVDLDIDQLAETLPAEVGGTYFRRGSYKRGVRGRGGFTALVRPATIAPVLQAWFGAVSTANVYTPINTAALPWATLVKDASTLYAEQHMNARIRQLTFTVPAGRPAQYKTEWIATTVKEIAPLSRPITFETEQPMLSCVSKVSLDGVTSNNGIAAGNNGLATNIVIDLSNQMTDDEFSVGSYTLDDVTLLERGAKIQYELILRDPTLYRQVFRNGAGSVGTGAWSPVIYAADLNVDLLQTTNTTPGELVVDMPKIDYLALPVNLEGNNLVRVRLEASITVHTGVTNPITATLTQPVP